MSAFWQKATIMAAGGTRGLPLKSRFRLVHGNCVDSRG